MVVPPQHRADVLEELHEGHPRMSRMKALAHMFVWWPGMDGEIEKAVRLCQWPTRPWTRLHVDFAGPICGKQILIVVDAHSSGSKQCQYLRLHQP